MPLVPSIERTTDLAASSARLKASVVPMSGLVAPLRTDSAEPGAADIGARIGQHLALRGELVEHRSRHDGHIEHGAALDLALDRLGRVETERQPVAVRTLEFGADLVQHVERGVRAQHSDFGCVHRCCLRGLRRHGFSVVSLPANNEAAPGAASEQTDYAKHFSIVN